MSDEIESIRAKLKDCDQRTYTVISVGESEALEMCRTLLKHVDELANKWNGVAAEARFSQLGKLMFDMMEGYCDRDNLPSDGRADDALNGWLRMRAARDEARADANRLQKERIEAVAWLRKQAANPGVDPIGPLHGVGLVAGLTYAANYLERGDDQ